MRVFYCLVERDVSTRITNIASTAKMIKSSTQTQSFVRIDFCNTFAFATSAAPALVFLSAVSQLLSIRSRVEDCSTVKRANSENSVETSSTDFANFTISVVNKVGRTKKREKKHSSNLLCAGRCSNSFRQLASFAPLKIPLKRYQSDIA